MIEKALAKLNNLKNNINVDEVLIWKVGTYFAIIDLSNGKHAAISKVLNYIIIQLLQNLSQLALMLK